MLIFYISNYLLILYPYQRKMLHYQAHTFPGKLIKDFFNRLTGFSDSLRHGTFSHYMQWLPPGMAAQSIQQAARGNWGASFAWLGVLTVISIVILYLWQIFVQRRLATADEGGSVAKSVRHHHTAS
ncbi:MAG: hypothetical protein DMG78_27865, partial [Acidobacteria bacterium]